MATVGVFGKIPSHGDFVSTGMASATARSFDKFSQMANDRVVQTKSKLPRGPIGFCFRDAAGASLLVGVMVGSRDSAGRRFPLSLFCELDIEPGMELAGAPGVFTPAIVELNRLALDAEAATVAGLKEALGAVPLPDAKTLKDALKAEVDRLSEVPLARLLERIYGDRAGAALGVANLVRACDNALKEGARAPVTVDLRATSDVELLLWLACAQQRLGSAHRGVSAFWDVAAQRALIAPGMPDSNTLNFLSGSVVQFHKLWGSGTAEVSEQAEQRAARGLSDDVAELLADPKATLASEFVRALSPTVRGE